MRRFIKVLFIVVVALVVGHASSWACKPLAQRISEGVQIVGVSDVTHLSTSGMNLYLDVDNATGHRLVIQEAEVDIIAGGEVLATVLLRDKVVIKRKQCSTVLVPLRFRARSSFVLGRLLARMLERDSEMAVSYRVRGGVGCFMRRVEAEEVAVSSLFEGGGVSGLLIRDIKNLVENL
jgi:hypothetical protein